MADKYVISVFGSGEVSRGSEEYATAELVGGVLGELGYTVATGGYGGAMEAVSRGAGGVGATVIGVTCRLWHARANDFVDRIIATADPAERLQTLIELGKAGYVVLPGATGTLRELAEAWEMIGKEIIPPRPIVCVGDYWRPVAELIGRAKPETADRVSFVDSPAGLIEQFKRI